MANVYTPNTVKACTRFEQNGETTCNVYYFDVGGEPTEQMLRTIATMLISWWNTNMKPNTQAGTSLVAVEVVDWSGPDQEGIVDTTGLPIVGTMTGSAMPNNSTICVKLGSGLTGRSRRGRKYVAGLSFDQVNANSQELDGAAQTAFKNAFEALISTAIGEGITWVINSIWHNGVQRNEGINTEVTDIEINPTLDSQRRRLPERGK